MMSSFEWMELQSLTADITEARARLAEARSLKDDRLVRVLEQEIAAGEARRARIVVQLSTHFAGQPEHEPHLEPTQDGPQDTLTLDTPTGDEETPEVLTEETPAQEEWSDPATVERGAADDGDTDRPSDDVIDAIVADRPATRETTVQDNSKGDFNVWDQLTPKDLDRAKEELGARRAEMLARHAEELKTLEADRCQLEELEQAIATFLQKFNPASTEADIVRIGEGRELRLNQA